MITESLLRDDSDFKGKSEEDSDRFENQDDVHMTDHNEIQPLSGESKVPDGQKKKRKRRKKDEVPVGEKPKRKRKKKEKKEGEDSEKKKSDKFARRNIRFVFGTPPGKA